MKKIIKNILVCLMMVFPLVFAGCSCGKDKGSEKVMVLSTNPELRLVIDENDKVEKVVYGNEDATTLFSNQVLVGKTSEEAVQIFMELSALSGHLASEVSVNVNGSNEKDVEELKNKAKAKVESIASSLGKEIKVNLDKYSKEANHLALVESIYALRPSLDKEELKNKTDEELMDILEEIYDDYEGLALSKINEIEAMIKSLFEAQIKAIELVITLQREQLATCEAKSCEKIQQGIKQAEEQLDDYLEQLETKKEELVTSAKQAFKTIKETSKETLKTSVKNAKTKFKQELDAAKEEAKISKEQYDYWLGLAKKYNLEETSSK